MPFRHESLPYFAKLTLIEQQDAVMRLAQYVSICQDVIASGGDLRDSRTFTWRAMRSFGFLPNSSLFSTMGSDDVVEIYDTQNVQIFRNLQFFKYCSYTLEDLYSRSWPELFIRENQAHTEAALALITALIETKSRETIVPDLETQIVYETDSRSNVRVEIDFSAISILYDRSEQPRAFISVETFRVL